MSVFLHILGNNIIPIFTIIGLGYLLDRKFELNMFTISKLTFYLFTPAFIFYNLYTTDLDLSMVNIIVFLILYFIINDVLARIIGKALKYDLGLTNAFKNSIMFNNSGNIGVSLITLVFTSGAFLINGETPYLGQALSVQIIVLVLNNITINTLGFYNAGRANMNFKDSIIKILSMPVLYTTTIALLLKYSGIDITPTPAWPTIKYISNGLVPINLFALGIQISQSKFDFKNHHVYLSVFSRLIIGPILALGIIYIFGFSGIIAQTLLISCSVPTAVNTALIAVEFENNESFATQTVMMSTIFSAITLTTVIYFAGILFPV